MSAGAVPEEGELRVGSVTLPAGRRVFARQGSGVPVAWATYYPVTDAGFIWEELSAMVADTGLVPFLLAGLGGNTSRPWDQGEFAGPADVGALDGVDAGEVLESLWNLRRGPEGHAGLAAARAPFPRQFPGLAPATTGDGEMLPYMRVAIFGEFGSARIGLVPAARPADVLPRIGWTGAVSWWWPDCLPMAAVLRSWEDRFGARLIEVGYAAIRLVVARPPHTFDEALRIAAEHYAFCDESGMRGNKDVNWMANDILHAPTWNLWWD